MNFIICDSKGWYVLNSELKQNNEILIITKREELNLNKIKMFKTNYVFFINWNWIVDETIFSNYECILFHKSPLPYGKGRSLIQNLIIRGYNESPVCSLKMTKEIDSGPICSKIEISLEDSLHEIFERINLVINKLITSKKIITKEQIGDTYLFKRISEKYNEIPKNISLKKVYDHIRMLDYESYPNAFIKYGEIRFEFFNAKFKKGFLLVNCKIKE